MRNYFDLIPELVAEQKWLDQFLSGQGYCIICNHDDPLDLEYHHIAGRCNDYLTVSVCRNCHGRLSRKQRLWPQSWTGKDNPPSLRDGFFMRGLSEIFKMRADRIFEKYA